MEDWREDILSMLNLEDDWDSYGGVGPSQVTVQRAIELVEKVNLTPLWVSPEADGGISMEFQDIHCVEVGVRPDGTFEYLFVPKETSPDQWEEGGGDDAEIMADMIQTLVVLDLEL